MKAITREYLVEIICRAVNKTIVLHRNSKNKELCWDAGLAATDEEIFDFIYYIPWFDNKLKDFLVGNLADTTTIISQAWETEFLKKAMLWAESFEWLRADDQFLNEAHINSLKATGPHLSLPY